MAQTIAHSGSELHGASIHEHHELSFFNKYIWSEDHKTIAIQYLFSTLFFLIVGGLLPKLFVTDSGAFSPGGYNALFTMHATVMVFLVVMPLLVGVFGNFLIPLEIGAPDMAFPFFNALSFWLFFTSGIVLLASFFAPNGMPASGWTSYAPLSSHGAFNGTQAGQSLWCIGIFINGLSSIAGATNYITTVINMRAPGMKTFRLPLPIWALLVTAFLLLLAVPVLFAAAAMWFFVLNFGTSFFSGDISGQHLLCNPFFWSFGLPGA